MKQPRTRRATPPAAATPDPPATAAPVEFAWPAAIIFATAVVFRLVHIWNIRRAPFFSVLMGDAHGYDEWAQRIAGGQWFGGEVFYQAPLYPYFLGSLYALLGRDLLLVRVAQALIGSASCVLLGLAAARLFSRRAGWIAGLGLAVYAPAIFFDGLVQKSVLDVFFITLTVCILAGVVVPAPPARPGPPAPSARPARPGQPALPAGPALLLLGVAMGALSLTRENALALVLVVLVWLLLVRPKPDTTGSRVRGAAAFVLGVALLLVPVALRNYAVGGGFYLTTAQFGPNFYIGNNPRADGTYASLRFGRGAPEYERQDATELAELAAGRTLTPSEVSGYWTDRAFDFIASEPVAWLRLMGRKAALLVNRTEMLDTESQETYAEWSWPLKLTGWFAHFGVLVPLAVLGMWVAWPDRRRLAVFYGLAAVYAASVLAFYVFARYRFPLVPLLFVFAACGLAAFWEKAAGEGPAPAAMPSRGQENPRRGISVSSRRGWGPGGSEEKFAGGVAMVVVAVVAAANIPLLSSTRMKAITESNLGAALHAKGRLDEAVAHYQRAIELQPDYAPAFNNMGVALRARGDTARAMASYQRALQAVPGYPDAHYNLANALLEQDKPAEAAAHFREALKSIPGSARAHNNLGIALANEGRLDEAIQQFEQAVRLDPDAANAHKNLGSALIEKNRVDEGVRHLQRASRIDPGNAATHYDLGVVYLAATQFADAVVELRWALELDPKLAAAHNNLGIALASQGFLEEAIGHWQQALALDPNFDDPKRNIETARQAIRK